MSTFADSFTGTAGQNLEARTGWGLGAESTGSGAAKVDSSNRLRSAAANATYYTSVASKKCSATFTRVSAVTNATAGLCLRLQTAANTCLFARGHDTFARWELWRVVAGSYTNISNSSTGFPSYGNSVAIEFEDDGLGTAMFRVDGVDVLGVTDLSTPDGRAGVRFDVAQADGTGLVLDDFSADYIGSGPGTFTVSPTQVYAGTTGNVLTLSGTSTPWTSGTPGGPTFTVANSNSGTGTAATAQSVASTTSATVTVTAGGKGTITVMDPDSGATATVAVVNPYDVERWAAPLTGDWVTAVFPTGDNPATARPLVVWFHGAGGNDQEPNCDTAATFNLFPSFKRMTVDLGWRVAAPNEATSQNWGNDAALAACRDAVAEAKVRYNTTHVLLMGGSMGGLLSLLLLSNGTDPAGVVGWAGLSPVCNLANLYSLWAASLIDAAYGITGTAPNTYALKTAGHDPNLKAGTAFRSLRMRFYASAGDTLVPKTNNADALAALVDPYAPEADVVTVTGDHGDASTYPDPADLTDFYQRCLDAANAVVGSAAVAFRATGTATGAIAAAASSRFALTAVGFGSSSAAGSGSGASALAFRSTAGASSLTAAVASARFALSGAATGTALAAGAGVGVVPFVFGATARASAFAAAIGSAAFATSAAARGRASRAGGASAGNPFESLIFA